MVYYYSFTRIDWNVRSVVMENCPTEAHYSIYHILFHIQKKENKVLNGTFNGATDLVIDKSNLEQHMHRTHQFCCRSYAVEIGENHARDGNWNIR